MLLVVAVILVFIYLLKVPVQPKYNDFLTEREVQFKVFGLSDSVLIDDNPEFISPIEKEKPYTLNLKPGEYYWKDSNSFLVGKFTIQSEVNVRLEKNENNYTIHNLGNVPVGLDIEKKGFLTGAAVVNFGDSVDLDLDENSVVIASQSD